MQKERVLSVDDDENLQLVISQYLEDDGYAVVTASDVKSALIVLHKESIDVILLDLTLPDGAGLTLIPRFREISPHAVILVVSGKTETAEKIVCLEMGADDYITKPFEMRELSARIRSALRRAGSLPAGIADIASTNEPVKQSEKIYFGAGWCLDRSQYQLFNPDGVSAELTTGEFKLLEALVSACNRVLTREHLFDLTREGRFEVFDRAIDIQIARLRRKLNDDIKSPKIIKTVRGVGYMFCSSMCSVA